MIFGPAQSIILFYKFDITFHIPSKPEFSCSLRLASASSISFLHCSFIAPIFKFMLLNCYLKFYSICLIFSVSLSIVASVPKLSDKKDWLLFISIVLFLASVFKVEPKIFYFSSVLLQIWLTRSWTYPNCLFFNGALIGLSNDVSVLFFYWALSICSILSMTY
mgnify:FL=1